MKPLLLVVLASSLCACSLLGTNRSYSGPADYAYTLTVSCFCPYVGPLRITVRENLVVDVRQLDPPEEGGNPDAFIAEQARTLDELVELVDRARREADKVDVKYDTRYGFPTDVSIDWHKDAVDDEVGYTVRDFEAL